MPWLVPVNVTWRTLNHIRGDIRCCSATLPQHVRFFWVKTIFLAYPNKQPENKDFVKTRFGTHGAEICNEFANFFPEMDRERLFLRNTVPMYMDHLDILTRKTIPCQVHVVKLQTPNPCCHMHRRSATLRRGSGKTWPSLPENESAAKEMLDYTSARASTGGCTEHQVFWKDCLESSGWTKCKPNLLATLYTNLNRIPSKKFKIILILAAEVAGKPCLKIWWQTMFIET